MKGINMIKLQISGTKNDLIAFQRWMKRAGKIPPYFFIDGDTKLTQNPKSEKYYRYKADVLIPLNKKGGKSCAK